MSTPSYLSDENNSITKADPAEIRRALDLILGPGQVTELRALGVSSREYRKPHTVSGYYEDRASLVDDAVSVCNCGATGVYFIVNPINPALLARTVNRCTPVTDGDLTADRDILHRRWLLIDVDAVRPTRISSTNAEHESALARAREIRDALRHEGWPGWKDRK